MDLEANKFFKYMRRGKGISVFLFMSLWPVISTVLRESIVRITQPGSKLCLGLHSLTEMEARGNHQVIQ